MAMAEQRSMRFPAHRGYPQQHWAAVADVVLTHPDRAEFYFSPAGVVSKAYRIPRATALYWVRRTREEGWLRGNEPGWQFEEAKTSASA
jgi:2-polyprenyl-6-methoxyphenol hydroxylase-like FAD-dependent oxidoreductase